jgi:hypothetical protein
LAVKPPLLEQIHLSLITLGTQAQVKSGRRALHGLCSSRDITIDITVLAFLILVLAFRSIISAQMILQENIPVPAVSPWMCQRITRKNDRSIAASTPQTEETCLHIQASVEQNHDVSPISKHHRSTPNKIY